MDVWARRPDLHTAAEIQWSLCDGCPKLTVKPRDWAKHEKHTFYCDSMRKGLTRKQVCEMTTAECPDNRELRRRRFK